MRFRRGDEIRCKLNAPPDSGPSYYPDKVFKIITTVPSRRYPNQYRLHIDGFGGFVYSFAAEYAWPKELSERDIERLKTLNNEI